MSREGRRLRSVQRATIAHLDLRVQLLAHFIGIIQQRVEPLEMTVALADVDTFVMLLASATSSSGEPSTSAQQVTSVEQVLALLVLVWQEPTPAAGLGDPLQQSMHVLSVQSTTFALWRLEHLVYALQVPTVHLVRVIHCFVQQRSIAFHEAPRLRCFLALLAPSVQSGLPSLFLAMPLLARCVPLGLRLHCTPR